MKKRILGILAALLIMVQAMPVMAEEESISEDNLSYTFTDIDGVEVTTVSSGKPKLVVFFLRDCQHCKDTLQSIASSDWLKNGEVDVCAIEIGGIHEDSAHQPIETADEMVAKVKEFRDTYCPNSAIRVVADATSRANNLAWDYKSKTSIIDRTTPWTVMIDKDNKIKFFTTNSLTASDIATKYLPTLKGETGTTPPSQPGDSQDPSNPSQPGDSQNPSTPGQPGDGQNPSNPDTPDTPQDPSNPDTPGEDQNPGTPEQPDVTPDNGSEKTACNHVGESNVISQATATSDALVAVECKKCGAVFRYETVSNSAYAAFLKETANTILNAEQNGEAVVNTKIWISFNKAVFEAMKSRPDVKVTVNYVYQGNPYVLNIPAKANVDSFMDENGFGGFRYIEQVLSGK